MGLERRGVVTADEFKKFSDDRFTKQDKAGTGKIPRPTPPAGNQPGMMRPQNSQQPIHLNVKPAPEPKPSDSSPQH